LNTILPGQAAAARALMLAVNAAPYTFFLTALPAQVGQYRGLDKVCQYMLQRMGNNSIDAYAGFDNAIVKDWNIVKAAVDRYLARKAAEGWLEADDAAPDGGIPEAITVPAPGAPLA
jgi:hypothetical protein